MIRGVWHGVFNATWSLLNARPWTKVKLPLLSSCNTKTTITLGLFGRRVMVLPRHEEQLLYFRRAGAENRHCPPVGCCFEVDLVSEKIPKNRIWVRVRVFGIFPKPGPLRNNIRRRKPSSLIYVDDLLQENTYAEHYKPTTYVCFVCKPSFLSM